MISEALYEWIVIDLLGILFIAVAIIVDRCPKLAPRR